MSGVQEEQRDEGVEFSYEYNELEECIEGERHLSPDLSGMENVTLGLMKQIQREQVQNLYEIGMFLQTADKYESQDQGAGVWEGVGHEATCNHRDRNQLEEEPGPGPGPFYFIGGGNGSEIVSSYCESQGWQRSYNSHRAGLKLKWCQTKTPLRSFKEGEQLVYQIPNNNVLTTKIGLLSSLRDYERVCCKVEHSLGLRRLKMEEFIPTTFRMDLSVERKAFFAKRGGVTNGRQMWICKPTGMNQGKGIFLLKSQEDVVALKQKLQHMEDRQAHGVHLSRPQALVVQHYIHNPLLLRGKKFDVRSYLLIACTAPFMVFFRHGYVRLTCDLYDPKSNSLSAHLTNQYVQKKNPLYSQLKEDTVWSMESFNAYVNDRFQVAKGLPGDWVLGTFAKRMQQIMTHCFLAVKSKLPSCLGFFDLIGCDFMIDEDFKVWLLEMNCNPALHTNCKVLKEVIPSTVVETLDLSQEIFNKSRLKQKILPLESQRAFVLLYNEEFPADLTLSRGKGNTHVLDQKVNKKMQETEPSQCKLPTKGKHGLFASPVNSVNVSERSDMSCLSAQHQSSSSVKASTLVEEPASVQRRLTSHLHVTTNITQSDRRKRTRPRVELRMSQCILHHNVKVADMKH